MSIKIGKTNRGFSHGEFVDGRGEKCSIQRSSEIGEPAIWLGICEPWVKVFTPHGNPSWKDFQVPVPPGGDVLISDRMYLRPKHVKALLPLLHRFANTGELYPRARGSSKRRKKDARGTKKVQDA